MKIPSPVGRKCEKKKSAFFFFGLHWMNVQAVFVLFNVEMS